MRVFRRFERTIFHETVKISARGIISREINRGESFEFSRVHAELDTQKWSVIHDTKMELRKFRGSK